MPEFDLITITRNSAATLQRTLDSVQAQVQAPRRHIFIDAGSEDGTCEMIRDYAAQAKGDVILEAQTGKGIAQAWNQALALAGAECLFILNSDDWWRPATMARVLPLFENDPGLDAVASAIEFVSSPEDPSPRLMRVKPRCLLPFLMPYRHPALFLRRRVYEKIGGFDEAVRLSLDYDWCWRMHRAGCKELVLDEVLTMMLDGGVATSNRGRAREETLAIGLKYGDPVLPRLAWLLRRLTGR